MRNALLSSFTLAFGGLLACSDPPTLDSYGAVDDGVGDGDGDGDPIDSGGSGSAACGDGQVGADEQCDDGNDVDDDACSNACTNQRTPSPFGRMVWEVEHEHERFEIKDVVVTSDGSIGMLAMSSRLTVFDGEDGSLISEDQKLPTRLSSIAAGPDGDFITAGVRDDEFSMIQRYNSDGSTEWTVVADELGNESKVVALGVDADGRTTALLRSYNEGTIYQVSPDGFMRETVEPEWRPLVAVFGVDGEFWSVADTPTRQVVHHGPDNEAVWTAGELNIQDHQSHISVDGEGRVYVTGELSDNSDLYVLHILGADGMGQLTRYHDIPDEFEQARDVVGLRGGGALVVGRVGSDALLSRYDAEGTLIGEAIVGEEGDDMFEAFHAAALAPDGTVVLAGFRDRPTGSAVWLMKLALVE